MRTDRLKMRGRDLPAILVSIILVAGLSSCESRRAGAEPAHGGILKRTGDAMAATGVEFLIASRDSSATGAWQDAGGGWRWIRSEQVVGTFNCEGRRIGIPKQREKICPQWQAGPLRI